MPAAASRSRLLWLAGAAALALAAVLVIRRRSSSAAVDTSGTPGPDLTGSAAQQPSGGASSIPGHLPDALLVSSDPVQQGVQATDASSTQAPTMAPSSSSYPQFTTTTAPGGQTFTTDVGGVTSNPANPATYNPTTGSWFEGALPAPVSAPAPSLPIITLGSGTGATGRKQAGF